MYTTIVMHVYTHPFSTAGTQGANTKKLIYQKARNQLRWLHVADDTVEWFARSDVLILQKSFHHLLIPR